MFYVGVYLGMAGYSYYGKPAETKRQLKSTKLCTEVIKKLDIRLNLD